MLNPDAVSTVLTDLVVAVDQGLRQCAACTARRRGGCDAPTCLLNATEARDVAVWICRQIHEARRSAGK